MKTALLCAMLAAPAMFGQTVSGGKIIAGGKITMGGSGPGVFRPGSTLSVSVTFKGPDVEKITGLRASVQLIGDARENQAGFETQLYPGESVKSGPDTFLVSFKIPNNQASGEYEIKSLRADAKVQDAPVSLLYAAADLPVKKTYRIENPNSIARPTIIEVK
jgi:hypothetical protein